MPTHQFFQLDVFTRSPLCGNPLAVFPEADRISDEQMQPLAREMNLSETTFVLPSDSATRRVRFFTPTVEIPLAGHPTIGTWWLLAEMGFINLSGAEEERVTQETGAGIIPVAIHLEGGKPRRIDMTQTQPEFGESISDLGRLGEGLGGGQGTVKSEPLAQVVSTALPQLMVPITSGDALSALPSGGAGAALARLLREVGCDCAMCYILEDGTRGAEVRARLFAPGLGVPEDPATGSAAGALGAFLVWHGLVRPMDGVAKILVRQGTEIGRPSQINVEVAVGIGGEITEVRVGGEAVRIIAGEVEL